MRIQKADTAFHSMWNLWRRELSTATIATRVLLYNACVKSILLYNIAATPLTEARMEMLEAAHRRHLRYTLKVLWPKTISNTLLYKKTRSKILREDIWQRKLWYLARVPVSWHLQNEKVLSSPPPPLPPPSTVSSFVFVVGIAVETTSSLFYPPPTLPHNNTHSLYAVRERYRQN